MSTQEPFYRFTERARKVLSLAQEEAQCFQHNYIGTEHLLLGLIRAEQGIAARVLLGLGADLNRARSLLEQIIGRGDRVVLGEIGLTPRARHVIELALQEAQSMNHHYLGTEHLLLGLIDEGEGIGLSILGNMGIKPEQVRTSTLNVLHSVKENTTGSPPPAQPLPEETPPPQTPAGDDPYANFTEQARAAMRAAQEEAGRFQHNYIGTEHLLLGLLHDEKTVAAAILNRLGVELAKVRSAVEFIIGRGNRIVSDDIGLTPRSHSVLDYAREEARKRNQGFVGTEHLLLGLVREGQGIAAGVLESLGVNLGRLRASLEGTDVSSVSISSSAVAQGQRRSSGRLTTFDEHARKALALAQEEAQRLQHAFITPEHLLLGLLRLNQGGAVLVLKHLNADTASMRAHIEERLRQGTLGNPNEVGLTGRAKRIIELAIEESRQLHHQYVGSEHLLLALLSEGTVRDTLENAGVTHEKVRQDIS